MTQVKKDIISAQTSLQLQTKVIVEDQREQEEVSRRRCNVIIHGLPQSADGDAENRSREDEDRLTNLLHELKCDEASVSDMIRLGRRSDNIN